MRLLDLAVAFTVVMCAAALIMFAANGIFPSRAGAPPSPPPFTVARMVSSEAYVWVLHDVATGQDYILSDRHITPRLPATTAEMELCPTP